MHLLLTSKHILYFKDDLLDHDVWMKRYVSCMSVIYQLFTYI